jgi:dipeptidyl aminopeptidase/acylaminoacyl peptidase
MHTEKALVKCVKAWINVAEHHLGVYVDVDLHMRSGGKLDRMSVARPSRDSVEVKVMQSDTRETALYREAEGLHRTFRQPGTGQISEATEVNVSPDGRVAVFSGTLMDRLEGTLSTRICQVNLTSGDVRVLTFGPNTDRLPKYSPDGRQIAFLSDRHKAGDFQLFLLDQASGARSLPQVEGWVEYLHWSPDGKRILLGVAGHGADVAGTQGAVTSKKAAEAKPSWMPLVETGDESYRWRRVWVYELITGRMRQVSRTDDNVWEAVWCGNEALAAVVSPGSGEGLWYSARLCLIDIETGNSQEIYSPKDQLGWPAASPSGKHLAVVEAVCSDRWNVVGDLQLIEIASGKRQRIDTQGVNVTTTEWRSDRKLLLAGLRGFETVVGLYDVASGAFTHVWASTAISTAGSYIGVSGFNDGGDCVLVGESFVRSPEIAVIRQGEYRPVRSFDLGYADQAKVIAGVELLTWKAPDGLEIQGWLLRPQGKAPHPLIMYVHGGPVSNWRPMWLGRIRTTPMLMLLKRGYAIFFPNPRGSSGRGQAFARHVLGDMGGADTYDYLSGIDFLIEQGILDPTRLGAAGSSYGGFMTSWLVTQDSRFAAAVALSPVTNQVSQHLNSNIPHFVRLFLADRYDNPGGKYFQRSPIMHAHKAKTPTLNICGALDRCTPPQEAMQFHNALAENGVKSVLVTYPEEGHGVRKFPTAIDYAARIVGWFSQYMPADN